MPALTEICTGTLSTKLNLVLPSEPLSDLICTNAERKSYGIRPKESLLYEDNTPEALYSWEVTNLSLLSM